jgi:hypothetical protein
MTSSVIDPRSVGFETWPITGLQTWEGAVVEVSAATFTADIVSVGDDAEKAPLRAEFSIDALDTDDRDVGVGDLFYLTARKVRTRGRLRTAYSIQLRRTGKWTAADIADIEAKRRAIFDMLRENAE